MKRGLLAVLVLALIAGCSGPQPAVDPARTLRDAGAAMAKLKTVTASLKFTQGAITFQGFTLVSARTSVRLPSDSDTIYTVKQQDFTISLEVVISGGHVYLHIPFSTFQELTGTEATAIPDLAKLFDPTGGLPAVIPSGRNAKSAGADKVGDVNAELWVGSSDHLIRKAVLNGAFGDSGKQSSVEVNISGFNSAVNITPPSP